MNEEEARYYLSLHYLITAFEMGAPGLVPFLERHMDRYPHHLDDTWHTVIAKLGTCWAIYTHPHEVEVSFAESDLEPSLLERQARNALLESVNAYLRWDFEVISKITEQASPEVKRAGVELALRHVSGLMCGAHCGHTPENS